MGNYFTRQKYKSVPAWWCGPVKVPVVTFKSLNTLVNLALSVTTGGRSKHDIHGKGRVEVAQAVESVCESQVSTCREMQLL